MPLAIVSGIPVIGSMSSYETCTRGSLGLRRVVSEAGGEASGQPLSGPQPAPLCPRSEAGHSPPFLQSHRLILIHPAVFGNNLPSRVHIPFSAPGACDHSVLYVSPSLSRRAQWPLEGVVNLFVLISSGANRET